MRIYLAGPSAELARVREAAALIEAAGHVITERWWEKVADTGVCASDVDHDEAVLASAAVQNRAEDARGHRCRSPRDRGCAVTLPDLCGLGLLLVFGALVAAGVARDLSRDAERR